MTRTSLTAEREAAARALRRALSGTGAHADTAAVFDGLHWELAGVCPDGLPHSTFELLNHMVYWQEWVEKWLAGKRPATPRHASGSWPRRPRPTDRREWQHAVRRFRQGLAALIRDSKASDLFSEARGKSRLEMLHTIASHNSYHAGQVVIVRRRLGAWPPPSGGLTW